MEKIMRKLSGISDGKFSGKVAVIIGGTSGMGLATAKMLHDGGARVLVTGRSQAGLDSAQKELGKDALVVSSDARSLTDIAGPGLSGEGRVRHLRPALRQRRVQRPSAS
jgi:NAD(P)-dependent dehydrogenase (short-subunit alcohol dehydrogenase family)